MEFKMKAKLIKDHQEYMLINDERFVIATTDASILEATDKMKLSKQNCYEIFGVVDVEKLAEEYLQVFPQKANDSDRNFVRMGMEEGFIEGFNKAMELNKDKLFTLKDVMFGWGAGVMSRSILSMFGGELYAKHLECHRDTYMQHIQSLKQPTEMNVEIVLMKDNEWYEKYQGTPPRHFKIQHNQPFDGDLPKLDSEGCLILKKI
jgi:hypothetical protein